MGHVTVFVETYHHVLEMRENVFLLDWDLSPSGMVVSLELVWNEGTDNAVLAVVEVVQHEDLPILDILKSVSSYEDHPKFIGLGCVDDTPDGLPVAGFDSVCIGWNTRNLFERFLRRQPQSLCVPSNHLDPSFLKNKRPQFNTFNNPKEKEIIILSRHTIINDNIMFLSITPKICTVCSIIIRFLILNQSG